MTSYLFADSLDVTFLSGRPHSNAEDEQIENDNGEETSQIYFTEQIHLGHWNAPVIILLGTENFKWLIEIPSELCQLLLQFFTFPHNKY